MPCTRALPLTRMVSGDPGTNSLGHVLRVHVAGELACAWVSFRLAHGGGGASVLFAQLGKCCTRMWLAEEEPLPLICNWRPITDLSVGTGIAWAFLHPFLVLVGCPEHHPMAISRRSLDALTCRLYHAIPCLPRCDSEPPYSCFSHLFAVPRVQD